MDTSLRPILFAIGIGFLILPGLLFLFREYARAYRILGVYFLVIGFNLLISYLNQTGLMYEYIHLFRTASPTHYLLGPLGYFFVRSLVSPRLRWSWWDYLHFLPFVLHFIELVPLFSLSAMEKTKLYQQFLNGPLESVSLGLLTYQEHIILKAATVLGYQVPVFLLLKPFLKWRRQPVDGQEKLLLNWITCDFVIKCVAFTGMLVMYMFHAYFSPRLFWQGDFLYFLNAVFSAMFLLAYPDVLRFVPVQAIEAEIQDTQDVAWPCENNLGNKEEISVGCGEKELSDHTVLFARLGELMQRRKLFLEEGLSLQALADELGIKAYRLSMVIKESCGMSYSDYVNRYRLDYIKEKIENDDVWRNYSIESMAFQAGFGSRAAFYLAFRKAYPGSPAKFYGLREQGDQGLSSKTAPV